MWVCNNSLPNFQYIKHPLPHYLSAMDLHHQSLVGEREFHFWGGNRRLRNHHASGLLGSYSYRPPRTLSDDSQEALSSSPLLPWSHHYSSGNLSPSSRTRQIEQARKELMEMIRNLPETSFELSLKDIVDELKNPEEAAEKEEPLVVEEKPEEQRKKKRRKKKARNAPSGVLRCSSMDSGVFQIKMFLPSFLSSKKIPKRPTNPSKVSPRTSLEEERHSKSCRSSNFSRNGSGESSPRCWPFEMVKGRMRRQKTCNF